MQNKLLIQGVYRFRKYNRAGELVSDNSYHNIVTDVGFTLLANNLAKQIPDNDPWLNVVAVGTGTNTPASTDTQLQTELERVTTQSGTNDATKAYITGFYGHDEANGTLKEVGLFADALVGTPDDGELFSRAAINETKSNTETLTVDVTITFSRP